MARTALFRHLMRIVNAASRGPSPAEEATSAESASHVQSRRCFLASGAALGVAAVSLSGCAPEAGPAGRQTDVLIIGGGMAGLHCLYRLGQLGIQASLYEAASSLGGRIRTDRDTFDGQHCEVGGELIDTPHLTMRGLAAELEIDLVDYQDDDPSLSPLTAYFGGAIVSEKDLIAAFEPIGKKVIEALATAKNPDVAPSFKDMNGLDAFDAMSIPKWLDSVGAKGTIRTLLEVSFTTEFGLPIDECNALNLLTIISGETEEGLQLYGRSDERFTTKRGNATFIEKLAAAVPATSVFTGHRLVALRNEPDGRYLATFEVDKSTIEVRATRVVMALPFSVLRSVDLTRLKVSAPKLQAIRELGYGTNSKLMVGFSSRPWRLAKSSAAVFTDLSFQSSWETSRLQSGKAGILTNFSGGARGVAVASGKADELATGFVTELEKIFPGSKAAALDSVVQAGWPTNPLSKGSYAAYKVGQYKAFAGAEGLAEGNLHFCGEHTSSDWQGYMEGAAESGARVAREVATALGISTGEDALARQISLIRPTLGRVGNRLPSRTRVKLPR